MLSSITYHVTKREPREDDYSFAMRVMVHSQSKVIGAAERDYSSSFTVNEAIEDILECVQDFYPRRAATVESLDDREDRILLERMNDA